MNVDFNNLAGIEKSWDWLGIVDSTATDDMLAVVNSRGVFREKPLMRRIHSSAENSPLTAVGVTRKDEVDVNIFEILFVVVRIVTKQNLEAFVF